VMLMAMTQPVTRVGMHAVGGEARLRAAPEKGGLRGVGVWARAASKRSRSPGWMGYAGSPGPERFVTALANGSAAAKPKQYPLAPIHRSAWNRNSAKFTCRILDKTT